MGFYKIAGGIKEYNEKNIKGMYISIDIPFIFTYNKNLKTESVVLVPHDTSELPIACKDCFFNTFTGGVTKCKCPACMCDERKDEKDVAFSVLQKL